MGLYDRILERGLERLAAGDVAGAEKLLLAVGADSSARGPAMAALGKAYLELGRTDEAIACLLDAGAHERDPAVLSDLGQCLLVMGRPGQAETILRASAERRPAAPLLALIGEAVAGQDRPGEAIGWFERAIALDGTCAPARFGLARVLIRTGDTLRASGQLQLLLAHHPEHEGAIVLKADLALARGEFRQAIADYRNAAAVEALDPPGFERLAEACLRAGDEAGAVEAYETAAARDPGRSSAHAAAARLCERHRLYRRARRHYLAIPAGSPLGGEAAAAMQRIDDYFAHFDLAGEGRLPDMDDVEDLDGLPGGDLAPDPAGPPQPPDRFGRTSRSLG